MAFLVVMGAPGVGKGTQAKRLSQALGVPHISSGDIFREHTKLETALGAQASQYLVAGKLVPDGVTIAMIEERLDRPDCQNGAVLDGFPRTVPQAEALETILERRGAKIDSAILIDVPEERIIQRMAGRRVCQAEGHVYHLEYNPPRQEGRCDLDGSPLLQREDDQPETVQFRFRVYQAETAPVLDFYRSRGLLLQVDGDQGIEAVTVAMLEALEHKA